MQGNIGRVGVLLDQGVAVDSRGGAQRTPLMLASFFGNSAVAALLLDRGADVNAESVSGRTPATEASAQGHLDILQLLDSREADIHHIDQDGYSSLLWAALYDRLPVCEYLMAASNDNETALTHYGRNAYPRSSPETKALRVAALEAWWAAGRRCSGAATSAGRGAVR